MAPGSAAGGTHIPTERRRTATGRVQRHSRLTNGQLYRPATPFAELASLKRVRELRQAERGGRRVAPDTIPRRSSNARPRRPSWPLGQRWRSEQPPEQPQSPPSASNGKSRSTAAGHTVITSAMPSATARPKHKPHAAERSESSIHRPTRSHRSLTSNAQLHGDRLADSTRLTFGPGSGNGSPARRWRRLTWWWAESWGCGPIGRSRASSSPVPNSGHPREVKPARLPAIIGQGRLGQRKKQSGQPAHSISRQGLFEPVVAEDRLTRNGQSNVSLAIA